MNTSIWRDFPIWIGVPCFRICFNFENEKIFTKFYHLSSKDQQAKQCSPNVRSIWSTVDPLLLIYSNSLTNEDLIEDRYYLSPKKLLIKNKDKEPCEQEPHVQAFTIKKKFISFTKFMSFLRDRKIYVGLNFKNIKIIISTCDSSQVNLSDLYKEREHTMQKYLNFQQLFQVIWLLRTYNKYLQSNEKKHKTIQRYL